MTDNIWKKFKTTYLSLPQEFKYWNYQIKNIDLLLCLKAK